MLCKTPEREVQKLFSRKALQVTVSSSYDIDDSLCDTTYTTAPDMLPLTGLSTVSVVLVLALQIP